MKRKESKEERLERLRISKTLKTQVIKDKKKYNRKKEKQKRKGNENGGI